MRILVLNAGSATLKFAVGTLEHHEAGTRPVWLERGTVAATDAEMMAVSTRDGTPNADLPGDPLDLVLRAAVEAGGPVDAVGHRIVHGGSHVSPVVVDDGVFRRLETAAPLAPLHTGPALAVLRAAMARIQVPHVAVFDTAFFARLPDVAATYPLPVEVARRHGVRRYGFHGLAHRWMWARHQTRTGVRDARIVTLQLGSGCSAAAIRSGAPVDTSMGFTPLEGLMMRTRSGSIDPALVAFLADAERCSAADVVRLLNRASGLAGISGTSGDVGELLAREDVEPAAKLALDMFSYRVRTQIGAYLAALGGADAVVFGGGIGENAPVIRARCVAGFGWAGLDLDDEANATALGAEQLITMPESRLAAWVIPVDEEAVIAADTLALLGA